MQKPHDALTEQVARALTRFLYGIASDLDLAGKTVARLVDNGDSIDVLDLAWWRTVQSHAAEQITGAVELVRALTELPSQKAGNDD